MKVISCLAIIEVKKIIKVVTQAFPVEKFLKILNAITIILYTYTQNTLTHVTNFKWKQLILWIYSTPSSNLRHKSYETNINENEKNIENPERATISHININFIRYKFDCLL